MAQTGYTPILIYSSSTAAAAPAAGSLTNSTLGSELAINITDGKLFYKDNANAVQVIGWKVVPATAGGTGQTSYVQGDLLYATSSTALGRLADVATGNALISGGVGADPAWGKIGLTTHVSGTLPVANGGTGTATAFTAGSVVFAGASGVYSQKNANFFWDNTNNRLGINIATPQSPLEVIGSSFNSVFRTNSGTSANDSGIIFNLVSSATAANRVAGIVLDPNGANGVGADYPYLVGYGSGEFKIFNQGSEAVSISSTNNVTISAGNLVIGTSGKGIDFSATPGTGTSELLADYEEGTWTPTLIGGTTAGTTTYAAQEGTYTKVGRAVTLNCYVGATAMTGTGNLRMGGLPFTPSQRFAATPMVDGLNWGGGTFVTWYGASVAYLELYYCADDASWANQQVVNETQYYVLSVTYFV